MTDTIARRRPNFDYLVTGNVYLWRGRPVYVTDGEFQVDGRVSNHFTWRDIKPDGTLGAEHSGYADERFTWHLHDAQVEVRVILKPAKSRRARKQS